MHRVASRLTSLATVGLILAIAGPGLAQGYYGPPPGPPGANGQPPPSSPADQARELRTALKLRPDQEPGLQAFINAVTPTAAEQARMRQAPPNESRMTTPQRLDAMMSHMDEMRTIMTARVQATKAFYGQLSPDQQRAFDAMGSQSGPEPMGGPGGFGPQSEPPGGPNSAFGNGQGQPR